ncbi:MAG: hypothetical protein ABI852_18660 [Gemmatimonadaceae bacterium]
MQAPSNSRASAVATPEVSPMLVRMLIAVLATVTLLFVFRPTVVPAQQPAKPVAPVSAKPTEAKPDAKAPAHVAPAHAATLTTGSAQGALAEQTVGKSDAAPKEPVKAAPRAVRPTTTRAAVSNAATGKAKSETKTEIVRAGTHAPTTVAEVAETDTADAFAHADVDPFLTPIPRIWGVDGATMRGARGSEQQTVFISHAIDAAQAEVEVDALLPARVPRARTGEFAGAPFAVAGATFTAAGTVGHTDAAPTGFVGRANAAVRKTEHIAKRVLLLDEIEVTLPAGTPAEVGSRFVAVDSDRLFKSTVQIAIPAGVLEVVKVEDGRPIIARVVQQSGAIQEGQRLLPLETGGISGNLAITAVKRTSNAPETEVIWVNGDGLMPSLQSFIVLGAGEREGVKAGDQFALVKRQGLGPDAVEQRIAVVRVVRVTSFGSSAIVVRQDQPGIGVGSAARLIGRVQ